MNKKNVILLGFSEEFKNNLSLKEEPIMSSFETTGSLFESFLSFFRSGDLNTETTLVINSSLADEETIIDFLKMIIPVSKETFKENWNAFQKKIVVLLPQKSTLTQVFNRYGLTSYTKETDIEDFLSIRDVVISR
jgi:hypothetical protein